MLKSLITLKVNKDALSLGLPSIFLASENRRERKCLKSCVLGFINGRKEVTRRCFCCFVLDEDVSLTRAVMGDTVKYKGKKL